MAVTNHQQPMTVYQMVLDRVPFVINDDDRIFAIAVVSRTGASIEISGDWTAYLRTDYTHTFDTPATAIVKAFAYDSGTGRTTIEYYALVPTVVAGAQVTIEANYNEQLISRFIYEAMTILQNCFLITPDTNVGDEQYYSLLQKIIIADIVAYHIVFSTTVGNAQGGSISTSGTAPVTKYIKTAAAEGISTSWDYLNIKNTAFLAMDAKDMMDKFANNAKCNARQLGCTVEVCDGVVSCCGGTPIIEGGFFVAPPLSRCKNC